MERLDYGEDTTMEGHGYGGARLWRDTTMERLDYGGMTMEGHDYGGA